MDGGETRESLGKVTPHSPFAATRLFPLPLKGAREGGAAVMDGLRELVKSDIFNLRQLRA